MTDLAAAPLHRSTIGCVIPASNEQSSIAEVIESLLSQTRVPDVIHVVVRNTSDATVEIASKYAGRHELVTELGEQFTEVFVHDIGRNSQKKVDALNYGYMLVEGCDYLLGVDADAVAGAKAVERLEFEAVSDTRIGGISAIYSIDRSITGGRFSIFSTQALRDIMARNHRSTPWVKDSDVEDSLLSLQIGADRRTGITPFARFVRVTSIALVAGALSIAALSRWRRISVVGRPHGRKV
ncbi:glycosyltransferase [Microbacterium sp. SSM24]|uniref:glycosyltransferase n=1 Tax=Microbacterium sp. SSM24 TaxID=2991714 RepID=UPI0022268B1F|nr:glycosyltransferase [Microbacterium sp. SSM24]MCW3492330.1 glycosyltransferase [Microbacterium sp. SSM24]